MVIQDEEGIPLGSQSFGWFYPDTGFDMLADMVETKPNLIKFIKVITDMGTTLTIEEFLRMFDGEDGLQIRRKT